MELVKSIKIVRKPQECGYSRPARPIMSSPSCRVMELMPPTSTTPEGVALRVMKASDLPHVRALHRHLLPVSYPTAFFIQLLVNSRRLCLVATEGGAIVGFASAAIGLLQPGLVGGPDVCADRDYLESFSDIPRLHVTLLTLGVLPAYQRRGIGRSLVHGVVQHLEGSCSTSTPQPYHPSTNHTPTEDNKIAVLVQVQVAPSNSVGKCFYTRLGMIDQRVSDDPRLRLGLASQTMEGVLCV